MLVKQSLLIIWMFAIGFALHSQTKRARMMQSLVGGTIFALTGFIELWGISYFLNYGIRGDANWTAILLVGISLFVFPYASTWLKYKLVGINLGLEILYWWGSFLSGLIAASLISEGF